MLRFDLEGSHKLEMENSEVKSVDSSQCVQVAVNIRPLITSELLIGCTDCISVSPGEPQVPKLLFNYFVANEFLAFILPADEMYVIESLLRTLEVFLLYLY